MIEIDTLARSGRPSALKNSSVSSIESMTPSNRKEPQVKRTGRRRHPSPCLIGVKKWLTFLVIRRTSSRRLCAEASNHSSTLSLVELLLTNWIAAPPDWSPPAIVFE